MKKRMRRIKGRARSGNAGEGSKLGTRHREAEPLNYREIIERYISI